MALGTLKNLAAFPFEVEGWGVGVGEDGGEDQFEFELEEVEKFENAELEAVLAVGLPGCAICGNAWAIAG